MSGEITYNNVISYNHASPSVVSGHFTSLRISGGMHLISPYRSCTCQIDSFFVCNGWISEGWRRCITVTISFDIVPFPIGLSLLVCISEPLRNGSRLSTLTNPPFSVVLQTQSFVHRLPANQIYHRIISSLFSLPKNVLRSLECIHTSLVRLLPPDLMEYATKLYQGFSAPSLLSSDQSSSVSPQSVASHHSPDVHTNRPSPNPAEPHTQTSRSLSSGTVVSSLSTTHANHPLGEIAFDFHPRLLQWFFDFLSPPCYRSVFNSYISRSSPFSPDDVNTIQFVIDAPAAILQQITSQCISILQLFLAAALCDPRFRVDVLSATFKHPYRYPFLRRCSSLPL